MANFYIAVNNDMYSSSNQQLKNNVRSIAEAVVIATMTDIRGYHTRVSYAGTTEVGWCGVSIVRLDLKKPSSQDLEIKEIGGHDKVHMYITCIDEKLR